MHAGQRDCFMSSALRTKRRATQAETTGRATRLRPEDGLSSSVARASVAVAEPAPCRPTHRFAGRAHLTSSRPTQKRLATRLAPLRRASLGVTERDPCTSARAPLAARERFTSSAHAERLATQSETTTPREGSVPADILIKRRPPVGAAELCTQQRHRAAEREHFTSSRPRRRARHTVTDNDAARRSLCRRTHQASPAPRVSRRGGAAHTSKGTASPSESASPRHARGEGLATRSEMTTPRDGSVPADSVIKRRPPPGVNRLRGTRAVQAGQRTASPGARFTKAAGAPYGPRHSRSAASSVRRASAAWWNQPRIAPSEGLHTQSGSPTSTTGHRRARDRTRSSITRRTRSASVA